MIQHEVRAIESDEAAAFGALGNLLVFVGYGAPRVQQARHFRSVVDRHAKSNPEGIGMLGVIAGSSVPDGDARKVIVDIFSAYADRLHAAFVLQGSGFSVAAQRSILAAALMATRRSKSIAIDRSLPGALGFLRTTVPELGAYTPRQLEECVLKFVSDNPAP